MLLLTQPPTDFAGLRVAALTVPSQRIDGDFYDFFKHENRCLDVIVADVMGKGIPAALLAGATKSNFLEALCHLMAMSRNGAPPEPKEIVTLAHADMVRQLIDLESFVTLSYARLDLNRRILDLVDCGHTGMMVVRGNTGACETLHGNNLPLGIREGEIFDQLAIPFESGDLFLFYSDGITDIRNGDGELFGADRLAEFVRVNCGLEPDALVNAVRQAALKFAQSTRLTDDLTCVAVKIGDPQPPLAHSELEIGSDLGELRRAREFVREFCRTVPAGLLNQDDVARVRTRGQRGGQQHHEARLPWPRRSADSTGSRDRPPPGLDSTASSWRFIRPDHRVAARAGWVAGVRLRRLSHHQERGRRPVLSRRAREELYYSREGPQLLESAAKDNSMQIVVEKVGNVAVTAMPVDELDASNAGEFKRDIASVLETNAKLVLDLSRLRFVDSSGLGALISCLRKLNAKGGDLKLCGMSKQVRAVFELVRMHRVFDIVGTREEAVRAFGPG